MKAYVRDKKNSIMLSIAMIVKNEEKNLARCLNSLKPLIDAIPCEIIIADTGSTDRTLEIASQYTDNVFSIEWTNDFAAARNTTVERASGEWFLYLDADNWFVDLTDMIAFFQSDELRTKYDGGAYTVYNFIDEEQTRYHLTHDYRVIKKFPGLKFYGRIHEHLPYGENCYQFTSTTYHTGYVGEKNNKADRNIPLLERAIAEDDDEKNHLYFQLAREYSAIGKIEKAAEALRSGIALQHKGRVHLALLHHFAANCLAQRKWEEAFALSKTFLEDAAKFSGCSGQMAMHNVAGQALYQLHHFAEASEHFEVYRDFHKSLAEDALDTSDSMWCPMLLCGKGDLRDAMAYYAVCLAEISKGSELLELLESQPLRGSKELIARIAEKEAYFVEQSGDASHYLRRYLDIKQLKQQERFEQLQLEIELARKQSAALDQMILEAFAAHDDQQDYYCQLMRLRREPQNHELLQTLLKEVPPYVGFAELINFAICENVNFLPFIERIDRDELTPFLDGITASPEEIIAYFKNATYPLFPCALRWKCALLEKILFSAPQYWSEIFDTLQGAISQLVTWVYGEDMPSDDILLVIPRAQRFGLYIRESARWEDKGDISESLRMLVCAGEAYPLMLALIKNVIEQKKEALRQLKMIEDEARSIEGVIKQKIRYMIHQGDLKNAQVALDGYVKLRPQDPDLDELRMQVAPQGTIS